MKNKIVLLFCLFQFICGGVFAQNLRFSYAITSTGTTSTANVFVQNIGGTPENLVGFNLIFYYNNAETTLTSYDLSPLVTLGWSPNSSTSAFLVNNNPTVSITHTGYRELSGVIDDLLVGTNLPNGGPPVLVAKANFDNTVGTPTGGFAYLAATLANNLPTIQYVGLPANSFNMVVLGAQSQTLPIELVSFSAKAAKKAIDLHWRTELEINFDGFEIERSENGLDFQKIGFEKGRGGSTATDYRISDVDVLVGVDYFYRLKMLDISGQFKWSNIEKARLDGWLDPKIYPNPTTDFLQIDWQGTTPDRLSIVDLNGKTLLSRTEMDEKTSLVDVSSLPNGSYFVRFFSSGKEVSFPFLKMSN
jgi:Secretion system C-terminal sorting domain